MTLIHCLSDDIEDIYDEDSWLCHFLVVDKESFLAYFGKNITIFVIPSLTKFCGLYALMSNILVLLSNCYAIQQDGHQIAMLDD